MLQILFTGDTAFGGNYQERLESKGRGNILKEKGYDFGFSNLQPLLDESRFVVVNLETTLTSASSSPLKGLRKFIHKDAPEESALALTRHGIDAVSLGNNHAFDYGEPGLAETLQVLERCGITAIGAGPNEQVARRPLERLFEMENSVFRLAIVAGKHNWREYKYRYYASETGGGVNGWTEETIEQQIRTIREADPRAFLVAFPHWGQNYRWRDKEQAALAQAFIGAGADLVIGHGAHTLQEIEMIDGRWVIYSLGNFLFNSPGRFQKRKTLPYGLAAALRVNEQAGRHNVSLRLYPILSDNAVTGYQPRLTDAGEMLQVHESLVERETGSALRDALKLQKDGIGHSIELSVQDRPA